MRNVSHARSSLDPTCCRGDDADFPFVLPNHCYSSSLIHSPLSPSYRKCERTTCSRRCTAEFHPSRVDSSSVDLPRADLATMMNCFVCNLPILSHQVGLVWQGGNGVDDLLREQMEMVSGFPPSQLARKPKSVPKKYCPYS